MALDVGTNSYINVADATTYLADAIHATAWPALSTGTKEAALITATRMLDRQIWVGEKTSPAQALQWPRTGVTDPYGVAVSSVTVPSFILNATCELAFALSQDPSVQTNQDAGSNIEVMQAGSAKLKFFAPTKAGRFPTIVSELVSFYLSSTQTALDWVYFGTQYEDDVVDSDLNQGTI